jgi:hypothetical protein
VHEKMFEQPIAFSSKHASTAVLRMADGIRGSTRLPMFVTAFMSVQTTMVGSLALVLRLGRTLIVRVLEAGAGSPAAVGSSAFLESVSIVRNDLLNTMRFQCFGLTQVVGATQAWGQALQHGCLLFPDTLEGVLTVIIVLTLEYPTVACACKLADGDMVGQNALDTVRSICLLRPLPIEETQWLTAMALAQDDSRQLCFVTMDRANVLLETAFDKAHQRMYLMTKYAAGVADAILALITADSSACDAFDVSPYVMSIIPEPVDYFSACVDTQDCKIRCLEEYTAFDDAKHRLLDAGHDIGLTFEIDVNLESMLFSLDDIEQGRHKPPFLMQELMELPTSSCENVCNSPGKVHKCIAVAGLMKAGLLQLKSDSTESEQQLAIAYYCVPIDVTQYAFQWPSMEVSEGIISQGFPAIKGMLVSLHFATTSAPENGIRDRLLAQVNEHDEYLTNNNQSLPTEMLEYVTKVLLYSAYNSVQLLVLRTSMHLERQLAADVKLPANAGYLHKIEHIQVDTSDTIYEDLVVQIYGLTMKKTRLQGSGQLMYQLPEKACVRCTVSRLYEASPIIVCAPVCEHHQTKNNLRSLEEEKYESDFVMNNMRICLKERSDTSAAMTTNDASSFCTESMWLPRSLPNTSVGGASEATLHLQTLDIGNFYRKDFSIPASVVTMLRVDMMQKSYRDMQNQVQIKQLLMSRVHYITNMASLRVLVKSAEYVQSLDNDEDSGKTLESVVLEIMCGNARDVHGGWMNVFMLSVNNKEGGGTGASLRNSLQAESSATVSMECSIHTC